MPIAITLCVLLDSSEWIFGTYKLNVLTWLELLLLCMIFYLCSYLKKKLNMSTGKKIKPGFNLSILNFTIINSSLYLTTVMPVFSLLIMLFSPLKTPTGSSLKRKKCRRPATLCHQTLVKASAAAMPVCPALALSATSVSADNMNHPLLNLCSQSQTMMMIKFYRKYDLIITRSKTFKRPPIHPPCPPPKKKHTL